MANTNSNISKKPQHHGSMPTVEGYAVVERIGSGSYSTVYKGFKTIGLRETVAIKCVERSKLSSNGVENIITEIRMLKMLQHEFIVQMKDFQWDERYIYIIMEYCDGGDLSSFIHKRRRLPESVCRKFLQQLALALKFLRQNNVCHLDLKPQNLLLVTQPSITLKVADFGFAQFLTDEAYHNSLRGSPLYMAPEMLIQRHYDAKVDLWSLGVIAYECLFGRAPYSSSNIKQLHDKIRAQAPIEVPAGCVSADCADLLRGLLQHDPQQRLSYDQLFAHPFLDLEHLPSEQSYQKAVGLVHDAVTQDAAREFKQAFILYCQALQYFVPYVRAEKNPEKKTALAKKVQEYTNRAEELKTVLHPPNISKATTPPKQAPEAHLPPKVSLSDVKLSLAQPVLVNSKPSLDDLRSLCSSTPPLRDALDIGTTAQMYLAEGQYQLALNQFQASLGVLVPLLATEPPGPRKDLLYKQIEDWLKQAESVKALIACVNMNQTPVADEEHKETCSVQ